jgi:hypothetical protein
VEASGVTETVLSVLQSVSGVTHVERVGAGRYAVESEQDRDIREDLAKALVAGDCRLTGMHRRARTLEDVFVSVVAADRGAES